MMEQLISLIEMESDKLEKCFDSIRKTINSKNKRIQHLEDVNKKLRDEAYKDRELQKMQEQIEEMRANYRRGFPITESEKKSINEWQKKHDEEVHNLRTSEDKMKAGGCIGGRYSYEFTVTSIGVLGEVKCSCGEKFCFCDLD